MIDQGADIRAKDYCGRSILHHAAWRRNLEAAKHVIELGAVEDLLARDIDGKTPLDLAVEEDATEVVEFLRGFMASCGMIVERPRQSGRNKLGCEGKWGTPKRGAKLEHRWRGGSVFRGLPLGHSGTAVRVAGRLGWVGLFVVLILCFHVFTLARRGSVVS
jgi:ankyrin repeat protein